MKEVVSVFGEIKMRGELCSLFSSKTMTHCWVCVAGSGRVFLRGQLPLSGPGAFWPVKKSWTSTPLLDKFDYKTSEEPQTAVVPIMSQSWVDSEVGLASKIVRMERMSQSSNFPSLD